MDLFKVDIKLSGLSDILFDRFIDHSKDIRPPEQKLYLTDGNKVVLPCTNIDSFLFGEKPPGCVKAFCSKGSKEFLRVGMSHLNISPGLIHFFDDEEKDIVFDGFDEHSKFWILNQPANTQKGSSVIKQEAKPRPAMKLPWNLKFTITIIKNNVIDTTKLYNWFVKGGMEIALCNYRPRFGRFEVKEWDEKEIKS